MTRKTYKSEAARQMAERKKKEKEKRDSKAFKKGSNPHMDGRGQSGQQRRK